ncbi:putative membrane protein [Exiguobacterium sp. S17]|nr:putative membrane protein [Exiguobacterium sp. S17]
MEAIFMRNWWKQIPKRVRSVVSIVFVGSIVAYMLIVGSMSVFADPNLDTLLLSVIGAALLTFIAYRAIKK